jgi:hypothetical protein
MSAMMNEITRCAADCDGMKLPHLPGYIVLGREKDDNAYFGIVEHSFSLGTDKDRTQFYWTCDNASSNFGGSFKVNGQKMAEEAKEYWSKQRPNAEFEIWDISDPDIPVAIDWDQWRIDHAPADTLSGVKHKFGSRNPKFFMKD